MISIHRLIGCIYTRHSASTPPYTSYGALAPAATAAATAAAAAAAAAATAAAARGTCLVQFRSAEETTGKGWRTLATLLPIGCRFL